MVADSKVAPGYWNAAVGTKTELDARSSTGRKRANELVSMLDRVWKFKVSSLKRKKIRRNTHDRVRSC
jgi:hypothetical protein